MSIGMALLVHDHLPRAASLVQALHAAGCKIAIHVDAKVSDSAYSDFYQTVSPLENVVFAPRIPCEWGRFSLVQAQLTTSETLLNAFDDVSQIMLISGSCLPNRPIPELISFLEGHKDTDFIESVMVGGMNWIKGGLEAERFSLFFPLSFVNHRRRFDALVWLQRKLRVRRKLPKGLTPHIGSQWWTLTRTTLQAIINDPMREAYDQFFKLSWIPDESYFQSLARKHSSNIRSRSLTYARFDFRGKPMTFYDDHAKYFEHLDSFFVRKVWHGADGLYKKLLDENRETAPRNSDMAVAFQANIARAESRWLEGRKGLFMQGRAPRLLDLNTATTYTVLSGFDRVFNGLSPWLQQHTGIVLHEHIWSKDKQKFAQARKALKRNMASSRRIRDNNAEGFLLNFIWNHADDDPIFNFDPNTSPSLAKFISKDRNARVYHIRSAWLLDLLRENLRNKDELHDRVQKMALKEQAQLAALEGGDANIRIISLAEIYSQPGAVLEDLLLTLRPRLANTNRDIPAFLPYEKLEAYVEFLKDTGLNLDTAFSTSLDPQEKTP
ncbi:MAG TPA: glycosyl transferase [Rhodobacteraceae bacterium]|nr:glycosyl transferase [Paracoccaceae bacterium]